MFAEALYIVLDTFLTLLSVPFYFFGVVMIFMSFVCPKTTLNVEIRENKFWKARKLYTESKVVFFLVGCFIFCIGVFLVAIV